MSHTARVLIGLPLFFALAAVLVWAEPHQGDLTAYRIDQLEAAVREMTQSHERLGYLLVGNLVAVLASMGIYIFRKK